MTPYEEVFQTRKYELDADRLLRIQSLCNYMEEAAGNHADCLGVGLDRLLEDKLAWVLAKMRLSLARRPGAAETVRVATWPVSMERAHFRRDFVIRSEPDDPDRHNGRDCRGEPIERVGRGRLLATAVTQWVVMGVESRRLERFPYYITGLRPEDPPMAEENGDIRIPAAGDAAFPGPGFPVRLADIDQNRHVNNGRFIDFALEGAQAAGANGPPRCIELIFRAEGRLGDLIASRTRQDPDHPGSWIHGFYRHADGQELARARTVHSV